MDITEATERITDIIDAFLEKFNLTSFLGTDFGYYRSSDEVEYPVVITERFEKLWGDHLNRRFGAEMNVKEIPIFVWSILHEVGHSQTDNYFTDEAKQIFEEYKQNLDGENDEDTEEYYNIPEEALATLWAFQYIQANREEVMDLSILLAEAFDEFYNKVGIANDTEENT